MQACDGPPPGPPCCVGGAGENAPGPPASGAAPAEGNGEAGAAPIEACGAAPLTGGKAGSLAGGLAAWPGSGAGNAPCASAEDEPAASRASVSGTIKRLIIKAVFSGKVRSACG